MIESLKALWHKILGTKTGTYNSIAHDSVIIQEYWHKDGTRAIKIGDNDWQFRPAYDPFEDQEKQLKGEVESYFD